MFPVSILSVIPVLPAIAAIFTPVTNILPPVTTAAVVTGIAAIFTVVTVIFPPVTHILSPVSFIPFAFMGKARSSCQQRPGGKGQHQNALHRGGYRVHSVAVLYNHRPPSTAPV
jgi:hypothetical protein